MYTCVVLKRGSKNFFKEFCDPKSIKSHWDKVYPMSLLYTLMFYNTQHEMKKHFAIEENELKLQTYMKYMSLLTMKCSFAKGEFENYGALLVKSKKQINKWSYSQMIPLYI